MDITTIRLILGSIVPLLPYLGGVIAMALIYLAGYRRAKKKYQDEYARGYQQGTIDIEAQTNVILREAYNRLLRLNPDNDFGRVLHDRPKVAGIRKTEP